MAQWIRRGTVQCAPKTTDLEIQFTRTTREDLVRIPVAIFFFFFCPLITCGEESQIPEFGAA